MRRRILIFATAIVLSLLAIITGLVVKLNKMENYVYQLEADTKTQIEEQSEKIVFVDSRVDMLSDSVDSSVADLQESIDTVSSDLATTKRVLHNTNYALIKTQKSVQEKEEEIQELREELKK